jgi:hypothetical protein
MGIDVTVECDVVVRCKVCKRYWNVISNKKTFISIEVEKTEFTKTGE